MSDVEAVGFPHEHQRRKTTKRVSSMGFITRLTTNTTFVSLAPCEPLTTAICELRREDVEKGSGDEAAIRSSINRGGSQKYMMYGMSK